MKPASLAVIDHLQTVHSLIPPDRYTITLVGGAVLRWTSHDRAIIDGANIWVPVGIQRGRTRSSAKLETDTLTVTIDVSSAVTVGGIPLTQALRLGALDGADFLLEKSFLREDGSIIGTVHLFAGRVAEPEWNRQQAELTVKSEIELLDVTIPRNVYQSGCRHALYSVACGVNKASLAVLGTVTSSTIGTITTGVSGNFTLGSLLVDSGANAGAVRSIRLHQSGVLYLATPLLQPCSAGDTFTLWPGCNKSLSVCETRFNNRLNFGGQPFIPTPETIL